jgi:hypothetical protein
MALSFAGDIVPLFRPVDIEHMKVHGVLLDAYEYMADASNDHANARAVRDSVAGAKPSMPPGGPYWPQAHVDAFEKWMADGYAP